MKRRNLFPFLLALFPIFDSKSAPLSQLKKIEDKGKAEEVKKIYLAAFDKDGKHLDAAVSFLKKYLDNNRVDVISLATTILLRDLKEKGVDLNTIDRIYFTKEQLE